MPLVTAGFGVATTPDADSLEDPIRVADAALFQAKRTDRDRVDIDRVLDKEGVSPGAPAVTPASGRRQNVTSPADLADTEAMSHPATPTATRGQPERSAARLILGVLTINLVCFGLVNAVLRQVKSRNEWVDLPIEAAVLAAVTAIGLWFVVVQPLRGDAARERTETRLREAELQRDAARQEFDARVHRAMDMAGTEAESYAATWRALGRGVDRLSGELLLADSSNAHLKRAVESFPVGGSAPGCGVGGPRDCPAIRRSQTLQFASSEDIDACPHLAGRAYGDRAAVCVPVSVAGRAIGVLHATAPVTGAPTAEEVQRLESLSTQVGGRIGMLRVMEATHLQAATDPLTGLLNRRSFEHRLQELLSRGTRMSLAMGDLDHFKKLNDTHGHDAGDRALRLFARTLKDALRSEDLVCRYGGEEFVVAFPNMSVQDAAGALQRVQEELVLALAAGTVPAFTASFGLAHFEDGASLEDACRMADAALFRAKREGRNRTVVDAVDVAAAR